MAVEIKAERRAPYQQPDAFGGTPCERSEAISTSPTPVLSSYSLIRTP
jgi:hypothetical protein